MSLVSILKNTKEEYKELRTIIDKANLTNLLDQQLDILQYDPILINHKNLTYNDRSLIGTSVDYLLRFGLQKLVFKLTNKYEKQNYVFELISVYFHESFKELKLNEYFLYIEKNFILNKEVSISKVDDLIPYCILFSCAESILRGGTRENISYYFKIIKNRYFNKTIINEIFMLYAFSISKLDKIFKLNKDNIIYNPYFSIICRAIDGADADLIISDTLIDLKTSLNPTFRDIEQVLAYYLLNGYDNFYKINSIALYYIRRNKFIKYTFTYSDKLKLRRIQKEFNECIEELYVSKCYSDYYNGESSLSDINKYIDDLKKLKEIIKYREVI